MGETMECDNEYLEGHQLEYIEAIEFHEDEFVTHDFTVLENSIAHFIDCLLDEVFMQTKKHNDAKFEVLKEMVKRRDSIYESKHK